MASVCPSTTTGILPSSFRILTASSSTGTASGRMLDLLKSKCTLRNTIFFFAGGGGGGAAAGGGGGGGGGGASAKSQVTLTPPVAQRMSSGPCSSEICNSGRGPRKYGCGDM